MAGIGAQTRQIFENMRRVLEGGGASLRDVVKITVFVTDIRYREGYGEVRQEFFEDLFLDQAPKQDLLSTAVATSRQLGQGLDHSAQAQIPD